MSRPVLTVGPQVDGSGHLDGLLVSTVASLAAWGDGTWLGGSRHTVAMIEILTLKSTMNSIPLLPLRRGLPVGPGSQWQQGPTVTH
jgi:hypothetical protein